VLLPPAVIERGAHGSRVWVVRGREGERGVAIPAAVEVSGERDGLALVRGAVRAGDMVITRPGAVREGMAVRIRLADTSRERGAGEVRP
jgi:hypothetical protein